MFFPIRMALCRTEIMLFCLPVHFTAKLFLNHGKPFACFSIPAKSIAHLNNRVKMHLGLSFPYRLLDLCIRIKTYYLLRKLAIIIPRRISEGLLQGLLIRSSYRS
ncbi:hypothetical protein WL29_08305 [Burkholderia ubonensis]|uniref:Uncharacterized protein n=1 Tax=Burkholderia ubonensis TaxID=101571 RepID=A0A106PKW2_9BURK|nr:hypothetical protein WL29_08305 [Burkholderia ubonensis]